MALDEGDFFNNKSNKNEADRDHALFPKLPT